MSQSHDAGEFTQKIIHLNGKDGEPEAWLFECPACLCAHGFRCDGTWKFNGDIFKPSFTPSLRVTVFKYPKTEANADVCHSTVTDGMIHYHPDCTHAFAGQTLELLAID